MARAALVILLLLASPAAAPQAADIEGTLHGFPALRDLAGRKLADGDFVQWLEDGRLNVRITYDFADGRRIIERAVLRQTPRLVQEEWSWQETRGGKPIRAFVVDLRSGKATAETADDDGMERSAETLDVEPGRTFAGFGFALAIKSVRERLTKGEKVELRAVAFTPKPRTVSVEISHRGLDRMAMSGRSIRGDHFVIHPKIPRIVDLFIDVPDVHLWLVNPPPAGFLRSEGPLMTPSDPVVRVDLLPGGPSEAAQPVRTTTRR
jgi:hypothetical protein